MIDIQKESVTHYLELHSDRFGRTWECSCGLWTLRADYGWTHTPDGRHARPVPAITPGDALNLHTKHRHHVHNPQQAETVRH